MMKEAESAASSDEGSSPDITAEGKTEADAKDTSASSVEGESSTDTAEKPENPGDKGKP